MGRRVLLSLVALACVYGIQPQGSWAEDAQLSSEMVMPDAVAALERMGEHLKTLNQFTLSAATTSEDVLDEAEKVMIGGSITYRVKTPDRLSMDIVTDKRERHYFYNGKTCDGLRSSPEILLRFFWIRHNCQNHRGSRGHL